MFSKPETLVIAGQMAAHAALRQSFIAQNVANADTPGFRALDVQPFTSVLDDDNSAMRATRAGHLEAVEASTEFSVIERPGGHLSPNGNSVSLESEMVTAAAAKGQHDRALAIYRASVELLRTSLGRR